MGGPTRRALIAGGAAIAAAALLAPSRARAEDVPVPVPLQIKLLVKVAGYDKNLPPRAGDKVKVAVVARAGNADAQRAAGLAQSELGGVKEIAGLPVEVIAVPFTSAADLKAAIQKQRLAVVYLAPGLAAAELDALARALDGVDVLTAAAVPANVERGVVLGFDLVSGKPKLVVHLPQAKRQKVSLSADVLKLAKVIE
jgi:hypothetical protein